MSESARIGVSGARVSKPLFDCGGQILLIAYGEPFFFRTHVDGQQHAAATTAARRLAGGTRRGHPPRCSRGGLDADLQQVCPAATPP
jgi:hypothetical protein